MVERTLRNTFLAPDAVVTRASKLEVEQRVAGPAVIVSVVGEVDIATGPSFDRHLDAAEAFVTEGQLLVVDLRQVEFFGSAGLAALAKHRELCVRLGATLCVVADHRRVLRPLAITGLDQAITIVTTVEEAIARSSGPPAVGWAEDAVEAAEVTGPSSA